MHNAFNKYKSEIFLRLNTVWNKIIDLGSFIAEGKKKNANNSWNVYSRHLDFLKLITESIQW